MEHIKKGFPNEWELSTIWLLYFKTQTTWLLLWFKMTQLASLVFPKGKISSNWKQSCKFTSFFGMQLFFLANTKTSPVSSTTGTTKHIGSQTAEAKDNQPAIFCGTVQRPFYTETQCQNIPSSRSMHSHCSTNDCKCFNAIYRSVWFKASITTLSCC